jgi:FlaA1/EpsC-like NDP-sugar epimerase
MHAVFTLCACVFTAQCRLDAAVVFVLLISTRLCCSSPNHITKQFLTSPKMMLVNSRFIDFKKITDTWKFTEVWCDAVQNLQVEVVLFSAALVMICHYYIASQLTSTVLFNTAHYKAQSLKLLRSIQQTVLFVNLSETDINARCISLWLDFFLVWFRGL